MDKQKLIHQLFVGKAVDELGFDKTIELLKEVNEAVDTLDLEGDVQMPQIFRPIPNKDQAMTEGFRRASEPDYDFRHVMSDHDHDLYYSGWMDCYDFITNEDHTKSNS